MNLRSLCEIVYALARQDVDDEFREEILWAAQRMAVFHRDMKDPVLTSADDPSFPGGDVIARIFGGLEAEHYFEFDTQNGLCYLDVFPNNLFVFSIAGSEGASAYSYYIIPRKVLEDADR